MKAPSSSYSLSSTRSSKSIPTVSVQERQKKRLIRRSAFEIHEYFRALLIMPTLISEPLFPREERDDFLVVEFVQPFFHARTPPHNTLAIIARFYPPHFFLVIIRKSERKAKREK